MKHPLMARNSITERVTLIDDAVSAEGQYEPAADPVTESGKAPRLHVVNSEIRAKKEEPRA